VKHQPDGSNETAPILRCSIDDPGACLEVFDRALKYASDTNDPNSFPQQLRNGQLLSSATGGPAELVYITEPWTNLAFLPPAPLIASLVASAREELSRIFEENLSYLIRINNLKDLKVRFSASQADRLQLAEAAIDGNMALINSAASVCYENPESSVQTVRDLKQQLAKLDVESLDYKPETFSQWYALLDQPNTLVSTQATVLNIANQFKTSFNNFDALSADEQGLELEKLLEERTARLSLECFGQWTPDLRVLSSLLKLEWIDINASLGAIELAPLAKLTSLKVLRIRNSQLESADSLKELTNLEILVLQNVGGIANLRPLSRLRNLKTLSLRGSYVAQLDIEPLARLSDLTALDLSRSKSFPRSPSVNIELTVERLAKIVFLDLSGTGTYSNLQFCSQLSSLRTLILNSCSISDLSSLPPLVDLEYLSLAENQIEGIDILTTLTALRKLNLGGNKISDLEPLKSMPQLLYVNVELNPVAITSDSQIYLSTIYELPLNPTSSYTNLYGLFYNEAPNAPLQVYLSGTSVLESLLPGARKIPTSQPPFSPQPEPVPFGVNPSGHALRIKKPSGSEQISNGDQVFLTTYSGMYLGCDNGLGKLTLRANGSDNPQTSDELFTVRCNTDGGLVLNGSQIQLSTRTGALLSVTDIDAGLYNEGVLAVQDPNIPAQSTLFFVNNYFPVQS